MDLKKEMVETQYVKMWIDEGIVHSAYPEGFVMTEEAAKAIVQLRKKYTEGKFYPGLADIRNLKRVEFGAMRFMASKEAYEGVSKAAVISNNAIGKWIFNLWSVFDKPHVPTRYFTDLGAAYLYLKEISAN